MSSMVAEQGTPLYLHDLLQGHLVPRHVWLGDIIIPPRVRSTHSAPVIEGPKLHHITIATTENG
jgi:hypothetical protein